MPNLAAEQAKGDRKRLLHVATTSFLCCCTTSSVFHQEIPMKSFCTLTCTAAIALAALLAGCDGETIIGSDSSGFHHLTLRNGVLTAHSQGSPDAVIDAAGNLRVDDKA